MSAPLPRSVGLLHRAALRFFPREYRLRHGDELNAMFEQRYEEVRGGGTLRRAGAVRRALWDLTLQGVSERWSDGGTAPSGTSEGSRNIMKGTTTGFVRDIRFGLRALRGSPVFTVVAVTALALGIGASTAIFSLVDALLLRPLPFTDPDRLMTVWETSGDWMHNSPSAANFLDWRQQNASFERLAAAARTDVTLTGVDEPRRLTVYRVSAGFFDILGVEATLGRTFVDDEDERGRHQVVVLSDSLWRDAFSRRADLLGTTILLDGEPHVVVGVMPPGFTYPYANVSLWVPMAFATEEAQRRNWRYLHVIGKLREGRGVTQAQAEMVAIAERLASQYPGANEDVSANVIPMRTELVGRVEPVLLAVLGAVAFVLLAACANVANLMLTRATTRRGEVAVRAALGAGRGRLVRQLMTESLLVAAAAGALGLLGGAWGVRFLSALVPPWIPLPPAVGLDLRMAAFALSISVFTAVIFGLAPALQAVRGDLATALRAGGRGGAPAAQNRLRGFLIVAEVALALVLLVGAGLMTRSFVHLLDEPLGFRHDEALVAQVQLTSARYREAPARSLFYRQLLDQVRSEPGVTSAAMITSAPLLMPGGALIYTPEGHPTGEQDATFRAVTPGYFATLGIGLGGRDFTDADDSGAMPVAVIGRELARRAWPGEDPLGKRLKIGGEQSSSPWLTVVGLVDDVRQWNVELRPRPAIYVPEAQWSDGFWPRDLVVRFRGSVGGLAGSIRETVGRLDPDVPVSGIRTLSEVVGGAVAARRFNMQLFAAFGAVALVLACLGIYGVIAYSVAHRTRELGLRVALGARRRDVLSLVMRQGLALVALGMGVGMVAVVALTRFLESLLYNVSRLDGVTLGGVALLLLAVATAATLVPAVRASRVDPMVALKLE